MKPNDSSFWKYEVYGDIRRVPWKGGVKRQWGCRERQFSAFSRETLEIRSALLYSNTESLVGFSLIPKFMTLNDLEWPFLVQFCFRAGMSSVRVCDFRK